VPPNSREPPEVAANEPPPVVPPRTWLAGVGWRRYGLVALHERPVGDR
jgi:hypothetical protein